MIRINKSLLNACKVVRRPGMLVTRLLILILAAAVLLHIIIVVRSRVLREGIVNIVRNLESQIQNRSQKGSLRYGVPP
jgi:hypothetical protein